MEKFLLGCDWGTSSFRLQVLDVPEERIIGEVFSEQGIARIHKTWEISIEKNKPISKGQLFFQHLKKQVEILSEKLSINLHNVTILISGMASSSIGMEDIPYAMVPFALDGSEAILKHFDAQEYFPHEVILISGVQSDKDVMRGEETQLIGLLELLEPSGNVPAEGIMVFPGTHSKHIYIKNGRLINFKTFMTGELFNVIGNYSILKNSVNKGDLNKISGIDAQAFKLGLNESRTSNILNGLFTVRTNDLFEKLNKDQNFFYLSGLLIGTELSYLLKNEDCPLLLCSGSNLYEFYKHAFDELHLSERTTLIPAELVDRAAFAGQRLIFENHKIKETAK